MNLFTFLLFFFDLTSFETSAILKMLLSAVCGGSIGLGREIHRHSAGLKTFSIVCLGSTLIMITNDYIFRYIAQGSGDLSRMAAQVVSGIGFWSRFHHDHQPQPDKRAYNSCLALGNRRYRHFDRHWFLFWRNFRHLHCTYNLHFLSDN